MSEDTYVVRQLTEADCPKVKSLIGKYEVTVRRKGTHYVGWAIEETEELARAKALSRLEYSRSYS